MASGSSFIKSFVSSKQIITALGILLFAILIFAWVFNFRLYYVVSGSMEPSVKTHSIALIKTSAISGISEGDIIAYRSDAVGGAAVLHRAIKVSDDGTIITKGDNSELADLTLVTNQNIIGKLVFSLPLLSLVIIIFTLLIAAALFSISMRYILKS